MITYVCSRIPHIWYNHIYLARVMDVSWERAWVAWRRTQASTNIYRHGRRTTKSRSTQMCLIIIRNNIITILLSATRYSIQKHTASGNANIEALPRAICDRATCAVMVINGCMYYIIRPRGVWPTFRWMRAMRCITRVNIRVYKQCNRFVTIGISIIILIV